MYFTYPNKPTEMFPDALSTFNSDYEATSKVDGFRTEVIKAPEKWIRDLGYEPVGPNKNLAFLSRREKKRGGPTPIPVSESIVSDVLSLDLIDFTCLDTEWMSRRTIGEIDECLFLLDLPWYGDSWQGNVNYIDRKKFLCDLVPHNKTRLRYPESTDMDFVSFFERMKTIPWTEGIVLKAKNSKIKVDRDKSPTHPSWIKIKWRSGDTGREVYKEI